MLRMGKDLSQRLLLLRKVYCFWVLNFWLLRDVNLTCWIFGLAFDCSFPAPLTFLSPFPVLAVLWIKSYVSSYSIYHTHLEIYVEQVSWRRDCPGCTPCFMLLGVILVCTCQPSRHSIFGYLLIKCHIFPEKDPVQCLVFTWVTYKWDLWQIEWFEA